MIASFGNLQVSVMAWREANTGGWYQVGERIVRFRQVFVHRGHDRVRIVRPGDREDFWMLVRDQAFSGAETSGDDDFSVLC